MNKHQDKNIGCRDSFNHPMQLSRHYTKCEKLKAAKKYFLLMTIKSMSVVVVRNQPNVTRHIKICGKEDGFQCPQCPKSFQFLSRSKPHLQYHSGQVAKTCPIVKHHSKGLTISKFMQNNVL